MYRSNKQITLDELIYYRVSDIVKTQLTANTHHNEMLVKALGNDILLCLKCTESENFLRTPKLHAAIIKKQPILKMSFGYNIYKLLFVNVFLEESSHYDIDDLFVFLKSLLIMHMGVKKYVFCLTIEDFCRYVNKSDDIGLGIKIYVEVCKLKKCIEHIFSTNTCKKIVIQNRCKTATFSSVSAKELFSIVRSFFPAINISFACYQNHNAAFSSELFLNNLKFENHRSSSEKRKFKELSSVGASTVSGHRKPNGLTSVETSAENNEEIDWESNNDINWSSVDETDSEANFVIENGSSLSNTKVTLPNIKQHSEDTASFGYAKLRENCHKSPTVFSGFNTALGNTITVAKSAVDNARSLIDNEESVLGMCEKVLLKHKEGFRSKETLTDHPITAFAILEDDSNMVVGNYKEPVLGKRGIFMPKRHKESTESNEHLNIHPAMASTIPEGDSNMVNNEVSVLDMQGKFVSKPHKESMISNENLTIHPAATVTVPRDDSNMASTVPAKNGHQIASSSICTFRSTDIGGFKTGLGNAISISKESLLSIHKKFADIMEDKAENDCFKNKDYISKGQCTAKTIPETSADANPKSQTSKAAEDEGIGLQSAAGKEIKSPINNCNNKLESCNVKIVSSQEIESVNEIASSRNNNAVSMNFSPQKENVFCSGSYLLGTEHKMPSKQSHDRNEIIANEVDKIRKFFAETKATMENCRLKGLVDSTNNFDCIGPRQRAIHVCCKVNVCDENLSAVNALQTDSNAHPSIFL